MRSLYETTHCHALADTFERTIPFSYFRANFGTFQITIEGTIYAAFSFTYEIFEPNCQPFISSNSGAYRYSSSTFDNHIEHRAWTG
jgi:hypothetical protein